jgi:hypothetical protein
MRVTKEQLAAAVSACEAKEAQIKELTFETKKQLE